MARASRQVSPTKYESQGTLSYLDAGGAQTVVEITAGGVSRNILVAYFDCDTLTQNGVFHVEVKVDGTNYRRIDALDTAFTVASDDSVFILGPLGVTEDIKFVYTEGGDEGAARNIPYLVVYEE